MSCSPLVLARHAMATRFEMVLYGADLSALRAAGEEALEEIDRLEAQLSAYRPESELSAVNTRAAREPVGVDPRLFRLLCQARELCTLSGGAFDPTVAPLLRAWGLAGGEGRVPEAAELAQARERAGMALVALDDAGFEVRFLREGVALDLGAIGKGFAIERAAGLLRENGVACALIHGGTSTVCALGAPPDSDAWRVAIQDPTRPDGMLQTVELRDASLSVSAVHGKSFRAQGRRFGHVIDPRTGRPVERQILAAVALPGATESDALSTALLVRGPEWLPELATARPGAAALVVWEQDGEVRQAGLGALSQV